jgi:hypothetical protein
MFAPLLTYNKHATSSIEISIYFFRTYVFHSRVICRVGSLTSYSCSLRSDAKLSYYTSWGISTSLYFGSVSCYRKYYLSFMSTMRTMAVTSNCVWSFLSYLSSCMSTKELSFLSKCSPVSCRYYWNRYIYTYTRADRFCIYWWNEGAVCPISPANTSILSFRNMYHCRWCSCLRRQNGRILAVSRSTVSLSRTYWFGWWRWGSKDNPLGIIQLVRMFMRIIPSLL